MEVKRWRIVLPALVLLAFAGAVFVAFKTFPSRHDFVRTETRYKFRNILLALKCYTADYASLPPRVATFHRDGEAVAQSWRVLLLPYLVSSETAAKYDCLKVWNSPENLEVARKLDVFSISDLGDASAFYWILDEHSTSSQSGTVEAALSRGKALIVAVPGKWGGDQMWSAPSDLRCENIWDAVEGGAPVVDIGFFGQCIVPVRIVAKSREECCKRLQSKEASLVWLGMHEQIAASPAVGDKDKSCSQEVLGYRRE